MNELQNEGIVIVVAAGNSELDILSDMNNGRSLIIGSHDSADNISSFSSGKCMADVFTLGEGIVSDYMIPSIREGTSFAAPKVTATISNYMSFSIEKQDTLTF